MVKDTKRALRRHLTNRIKWHRLKFDMRDHGIPPRDYDPKLADFYDHEWKNKDKPNEMVWFWLFMPYRVVCDCFHDKGIQGKAKNHAVHHGYGAGCREAYDKEYWGGERLRVRLELMTWNDEENDPAPSLPKHSSRWNCD